MQAGWAKAISPGSLDAFLRVLKIETKFPPLFFSLKQAVLHKCGQQPVSHSLKGFVEHLLIKEYFLCAYCVPPANNLQLRGLLTEPWSLGDMFEDSCGGFDGFNLFGT